MVFQEIDDDLWDIVQNYLPPTKPHIGQPRCDPHSLFNGILYILSTGCSWHEVPANYNRRYIGTTLNYRRKASTR